VGIILSGVVTMLASFIVIGAPRKIKVAKPVGEYIGALREDTSWLGGAKILPAPENQVVLNGQIEIGGIPIDWHNEVYGGLLVGMPGAGKSQIGGGIFRAVNQRSNARIFVIDNNGEYYGLYGRPEDTLISPFSPDSVGWNMFAEFKSEADYKRVAASFVPMIEGQNKEWSQYERDLFADTARAMKESGEENPRKFHQLLTGPDDELAEYLDRAGLRGWTSPSGRKMMTGAKQGLKPHIAIFEYLKPDGDFSVRDWIKKGDGGEGNLFITYRVGDIEIMRQFVAALADIAIVEALSLPPCQGLPEKDHRRLFFMIDEMDGIGKISRLLDGLSKLRKYGCTIWLGIQTIPQIELAYGAKETEGLMGNIGNTVILKQKDLKTAEKMAGLLGKQDIERRYFTTSQATGNSRPHWFSSGGSNSSTGQTINEQKQVVPDVWVVSPTDLMGMPRLEGILVGDNMVHYHFKIAKVELPIINDPFREIEQ
jgi:hypothetical protein